jgi:hypothetical protein
MNPFVTANGKPIEAQLPCSIEAFLIAQKIAAARLWNGKCDALPLRTQGVRISA